MEREVTATFTKLGVHLEEDKLIKQGYSIDAIVRWEREWVAVEVDWPSHFLRRDGIRLVNGGHEAQAKVVFSPLH